MKRETLGYCTVSDEDFEFVVTKPLFALRMLGFSILKVNVDANERLHVFCGRRSGITSGIVPPDSDFWENANRLLDETT